MLKTRVIPVLLYQNGKLVKSVKFQNHRNLGNPLQAVRVYNSRNIDELLILDITKTKELAEPEYETIKTLAKECFMPLAVGGGISSVHHVRKIFAHGADKICINTAAYEHPGFITALSKAFGRQCVVVSIDVRGSGSQMEVITGCGKIATGRDPVKWAREAERYGAGEIFLTSMDKEGTMSGYDLHLIHEVSCATTIPIVAHGGAGSLEDCIHAMKAGASAIAMASLFHFTQITPQAVRNSLRNAGYPARIS